ncbi:MAG: hypothetical protein PHS92_01920 [Candidatus Gracilibacteria bacterium]|nr:hypothetical protein [Candidatus Gracilibacteria bacterium]
MQKITDIFEALTKKRYNRNEPHLPEKIYECIANNATTDKPIKLIGFWGVGDKKDCNWADMESCEQLEKLNQDIKKIFPPGLEFTFIFSTPHGIYNGIDEENIIGYTKNMEKLFEQFGFKYIYLDNLWEKYNISFDKIETYFKENRFDWGEEKLHSTLDQLASQINKRLSAQEASKKYMIMRTLEKNMLETEFESYIFHTYNSPLFESFLPDMPRLHIYSYKKGRSNSPWFILDEK